MNKKLKIALIVLLVCVLAGSTVAYFMWNKPRRNVENEKGIELTAAQLVKEYQENEKKADSTYLDKAIQVTGTVSEVKVNQEGKQTIMLSSDDAFSGVFCTLKDSSNIAAGSNVTLKGICSGMLSDVRIREAVVVSKV